MNAALLRSFSPPRSPLRMMLSPICRLCGGTEQSQRTGEESGIRGQREEKQKQAGRKRKVNGGGGVKWIAPTRLVSTTPRISVVVFVSAGLSFSLSCWKDQRFRKNFHFLHTYWKEKSYVASYTLNLCVCQETNEAACCMPRTNSLSFKLILWKCAAVSFPCSFLFSRTLF